MRRQPFSAIMLRLIVVAAVAGSAAPLTTAEAASGCGSRGGPGYRGPNGRCVGWDQIGRVCGSPPTTRCTSESTAVGAPEHAEGQAKLRSELRSRRSSSGQPAIRFLQQP